MLDTTVDIVAQIERELIVLLPEREERPPFTRDRISYSPERKIFTPKTTLAPGLQAQVRDNLRLTEEGSQEGSLPEEPFGRDINGPPTLGHPKMYKFQAIQFPTFNGMRRDWPAFRSAWKYTVEPQGYSPFYLAQQLKQSCKSGMAVDLIRAITIKDHTSYELMWSRLENFYSDQGAVLASLYADLDALKPCRNDGAKSGSQSSCVVKEPIFGNTF